MSETRKFYFWVSDLKKKRLLYETAFPSDKVRMNFSECFNLLADYTARTLGRTGVMWEVVEIFAINAPSSYGNRGYTKIGLGDIRAYLISPKGEKRIMCFRESFTKNGPPFNWMKAAKDTCW